MEHLKKKKEVKNMKKTKPDILAYIKHKTGEPADYATDEKLMVVLTIADKNFKRKREKNVKGNKSNKK
jgi:hypothetical protein